MSINRPWLQRYQLHCIRRYGYVDYSNELFKMLSTGLSIYLFAIVDGLLISRITTNKVVFTFVFIY